MFFVCSILPTHPLIKHWSPEQIANRLKLEDYPIQISYKTIYRAIYAGMFDTPEQKRSQGNRGKIPISHELNIVGFNRKSGLLTCRKLTRSGNLTR